MKIKKYILIGCCYLGFFSVANAQIKLKDVASIHIWDVVNLNYSKVHSYAFEIKIKDKLELWNTKQLSAFQFQSTINKTRNELTWLQFQQSRNLGVDSMKAAFDKREKKLKNDYQTYCDTVQGEFVKYIDKKIVIQLLKVVQEEPWSADDLENYGLKGGYLLDFELDDIVLGYYPHISLRIVSNSGDSLAIYNASSGDLVFPWTLKHNHQETFNPFINLTLYAILPKNMNFNRDRLIEGLEKNKK